MLDCSGGSLLPADGAVLASVLPLHTSLRNLRLDDNAHLGDLGVGRLVAGLRASPSVARCSVLRCGWTLRGCGEALLALAEAKPGLALRLGASALTAERPTSLRLKLEARERSLPYALADDGHAVAEREVLAVQTGVALNDDRRAESQRHGLHQHERTENVPRVAPGRFDSRSPAGDLPTAVVMSGATESPLGPLGGGRLSQRARMPNAAARELGSGGSGGDMPLTHAEFGAATALAAAAAYPVSAMTAPPPLGSRARLVERTPSLRPGGPLARRTARLHVLGDGGAGKATLVASLARGWRAALSAAEEAAPDLTKAAGSGGGSGNLGSLAAFAFPQLPSATTGHAAGHAAVRAAVSCGGSWGDERLVLHEGGGAEGAPFAVWVHRSGLASHAGSPAGTSAARLALTSHRPELLDDLELAAAAAEGVAAGLRPLACFPDGTFVVCVDLSGAREAQRESLVRHLRLVHSVAPPDAACIAVVGTRADSLGKLGCDYLERLVAGVVEDLLEEAAAARNTSPVHVTALPPSVAFVLALDARKSQGPAMKRLRALLAADHTRLADRRPVPAAPLAAPVLELLNKWRAEPVLPRGAAEAAEAAEAVRDRAAVDAVVAAVVPRAAGGSPAGGPANSAAWLKTWPGEGTPLVGCGELLRRCRRDLFPGLERGDLEAILRTLHRAGAVLLLQGKSHGAAGGLESLFVVLDEDWVFGRLLGPVSGFTASGSGNGAAMFFAFAQESTTVSGPETGVALGASAKVKAKLSVEGAWRTLARLVFGSGACGSDALVSRSALLRHVAHPDRGTHTRAAALVDSCLELLVALDCVAVGPLQDGRDDAGEQQMGALFLASPAIAAALPAQPFPPSPVRTSFGDGSSGQDGAGGTVAMAAAVKDGIGSGGEGSGGEGLGGAAEVVAVLPGAQRDELPAALAVAPGGAPSPLDGLTLGTRLVVASPLGGLGPGGWSRLQSRVVNALAAHLAPPLTVRASGRPSRVHEAAPSACVRVWSNGVLVSGLSPGATLTDPMFGEALVQLVGGAGGSDGVDVLVRLRSSDPRSPGGEDDGDSAASVRLVASLFTEVRAVVEAFVEGQRTSVVTPFDDLRGGALGVWACRPSDRTAARTNAPPSPVFYPRSTPAPAVVAALEAEEEAAAAAKAEEDAAEAAELLSSAAEAALEGHDGPVVYRPGWSVLDDLRDPRSAWGEACHEAGGAWSLEAAWPHSVGTYQLLLPHPAALELVAAAAPPGSALARSLSALNAGDTPAGDDIEVLVVAAVRPNPAADATRADAGACASGLGGGERAALCGQVVSAHSCWDSPLRPLVGLAVVGVSEVPFDAGPLNSGLTPGAPTPVGRPGPPTRPPPRPPPTPAAASGDSKGGSEGGNEDGDKDNTTKGFWRPPDGAVAMPGMVPGAGKKDEVPAESTEPAEPAEPTEPAEPAEPAEPRASALLSGPARCMSGCMSARAARTALQTLRYPLYLTLADPDEPPVEKETGGGGGASANASGHASGDTSCAVSTRRLRLVVVATVRQASQGPTGSGDWRLSGDEPPSKDLRWGLAAVELSRLAQPLGTDHTVRLRDHRVVAHFPLTAAEALRLLHDMAADGAEVVVHVHGFATPLNNSVKSAAIFGRAFAGEGHPVGRLPLLFAWPSDPELGASSWVLTKVMSEFERNYTRAEQHMHASIGPLVHLARTLAACVGGDGGGCGGKGGLRLVWRAHSMGNYLLLNALDRLCWLGEGTGGQSGGQSTLAASFGRGLILDAPDAPTWFFTDTVHRVRPMRGQCILWNLRATWLRCSRLCCAASGRWAEPFAARRSLLQRSGQSRRGEPCAPSDPWTVPRQRTRPFHSQQARRVSERRGRAVHAGRARLRSGGRLLPARPEGLPGRSSARPPPSRPCGGRRRSARSLETAPGVKAMFRAGWNFSSVLREIRTTALARVGSAASRIPRFPHITCSCDRRCPWAKKLKVNSPFMQAVSMHPAAVFHRAASARTGPRRGQPQEA